MGTVLQIEGIPQLPHSSKKKLPKIWQFGTIDTAIAFWGVSSSLLNSCHFAASLQLAAGLLARKRAAKFGSLRKASIRDRWGALYEGLCKRVGFRDYETSARREKKGTVEM